MSLLKGPHSAFSGFLLFKCCIINTVIAPTLEVKLRVNEEFLNGNQRHFINIELEM